MFIMNDCNMIYNNGIINSIIPRDVRLLRRKAMKQKNTTILYQAQYCHNIPMSKTRKKHTRLPTYNESDYTSNDGMLTTVWGPGIWHYLHTMSFNYPTHPSPSDKLHYKKFVLELQYVLPCGKCRKNLINNFKKMPLTNSDMKSRETFSKYIYNLHEVVNKMLNKKSGLTYDDVRERYEHFRARCAKPLKSEMIKGIASSSVKKCNRTRKNQEKGCVVPLYGNKAKCVLQIIPQAVKCETIQIDQRCVKRKGPIQ
jgi:hypothetical protein